MANRDDLFGNGPAPQAPSGFSRPPPVRQQNIERAESPPVQMGKTRMMNEIQEQIKVTFDQELDKLRKEMNSRQKALRNQMEELKLEAEKALRERNEANEELNRMKELLDKKHKEDTYHKNLLGALNKYKPVEETEYGERKLPSRGGVNMNIYEKAFFDKGGKDMMLNGGMSLKADSALIPVEQNYGITNYFNKGTIKKQEKITKNTKNGIPIFESTPEPLKQTNGYALSPEKSFGSPDIPTINTNIKNQVNKNRIKYEFGNITDAKSEIKEDDTFDFINKINGVGGGKKSKPPKATNLNDSINTINSKQLADKIDFDVFPALPDYEGIQSKFLDKNNNSIKYGGANGGDKLDSSMISDTSNIKMYNIGRDTATKMGGYGVRDSTQSLANQTTNTLNTLNSINLEKINNRNENRLKNFEGGFKFETNDDELSKLQNSYYK